MTEDGPEPQSPSSLRSQLVTLATSFSPGLTANLPGTLIEDIASTDVAALVLEDQAAVDLINSVTPRGANKFLLNQLAQIYGVSQDAAINTSVSVEFTGPPGFVIAKGFVVGDGTYAYVIQDGGVIPTSGISAELSAVANQTGSWAVPANTVVQILTSVPDSIVLSVTNPLPGNPGVGAADDATFRAHVLQAGLAASQGMARYVKTLINQVPGVIFRLVSMRQKFGGGWEVIVGGGDQYEVANAIFRSSLDISTLVGSVISVIGITNANPGVVTTDLNHGYVTGQVVTMTGIVGMIELNHVPLAVTVINEKQFSIPLDTTSFFPWISGGVCEPNARNVEVSIEDFPDVYSIPFVLPPLQTVELIATWNTELPNFVSAGAIAQLAQPALIDAINGTFVGQPLNLLVLEHAFHNAVSSVLPAQFITRLVFSVSINGVGAAPIPGTNIINGDPESYFFADSTTVQVNQG